MRTRAIVIAICVLAGCASSTVLAPPPAQAAASASTTTSTSVPFYVVRSSVDGQQEFLFEIAQRFLGDGNRFMQIFALNKGRPQPDGSKLTVPTSLDPGWILQLPSDAKGSGVQFGPLPGGSETATSRRPSPPSGPSVTAEAAPAKASSTPLAEIGTPVPPKSAINSGNPVLISIVFAAIVLVLLALALLAVVWWRRRRTLTFPSGSFEPADRSASWTIDRALKILTATCEDDRILFPGLYQVTVDATALHIVLSTPSSKVPSGWSSSQDGRTWSASLASLQVQQVRDGSNEQFAGLATLGTTPEGRLLIDFSAANGLVAVEGASVAVADVVEGWISELTKNPWSNAPSVVRVGPSGVDGRESIDGLLRRMDDSDTGVAVVEDNLSRAHSELLKSKYSAPGFRWTVLVKGHVSGASWKFSARDGLLRSGFLPDIHYASAPPTRVPAVTTAP